MSPHGETRWGETNTSTHSNVLPPVSRMRIVLPSSYTPRQLGAVPLSYESFMTSRKVLRTLISSSDSRTATNQHWWVTSSIQAGYPQGVCLKMPWCIISHHSTGQSLCCARVSLVLTHYLLPSLERVNIFCEWLRLSLLFSKINNIFATGGLCDQHTVSQLPLQ